MSISPAFLEKAIREAGALAMTYFKDLKNLEVNKKSSRDLVTEADVAVEVFLKEAFAKEYPQYGFWGEESGKTENQSSRWIVDPIDGTHSFSKGQYFWAISVALEIDQELVFGAVYGPALDDYYYAEKNKGAWKNGQPIRVSSETDLASAMIATGFACLRSYLEDNNLDLCLVADGQVDAYWEQELNLYDVAAGALIALEAGATVTDFKGHGGIDPKQILATNGKILEQMLPLM
jgi:myo-inositol-1(or 4)-monophosphatase